MITLILGMMGSGKSYEAVKYVILEGIKQGRRVVTNVSGLKPDLIAKYLKMNQDDVDRLLVTISAENEGSIIGATETVANDSFWGNIENTGVIQHGDVVVLDEAWKWLRDGKRLTPKCMEFIRLHRQWVGGPMNTSCDLYFVTQRDKDIAPAIRDVAERVLEISALRRTGISQAYMRTERAGISDTKGQSVRRLRDKKIFALYSSHKSEGASEDITDTRGMWYRNPMVYQAIGAFAVVVAVGVWAAPKVLAVVNPAGQKAKPPSGTIVFPNSATVPQGALTAPRADTPNMGAAGAVAPTQLNGLTQLVPAPNVISSVNTGVSGAVPELRVPTGDSVMASLPPSFRGQYANSGGGARFSSRSPTEPQPYWGERGLVGSPQQAEQALPPPRPSSFVQVLPLKGDPAAVEAVTKAFCDLNACRVVIRAQTSQVVLVGTNAEIAMLSRLLDDLGDRPPGLLVQAIILELDESANEALGLSVTGQNSRFRASVADPLGAGGGVVAAYSVSGFTATLEALKNNGSARVLTAPSVMSWAGEKSSVRASQEVPVLSQIVSENSGASRQGIEYRSSGILLDLEQVTAGPRPVFRANLEVSAFIATETGVKGSPTKSSRTLSTVAELPLDQVLLIGGIDRETSQVTQDRLPIVNVPLNRRQRISTTRIYVALIATAPTPLASLRAQATEPSAILP
jgi:zona occludens toxin